MLLRSVMHPVDEALVDPEGDARALAELRAAQDADTAELARVRDEIGSRIRARRRQIDQLSGEVGTGKRRVLVPAHWEAEAGGTEKRLVQDSDGTELDRAPLSAVDLELLAQAAAPAPKES